MARKSQKKIESWLGEIYPGAERVHTAYNRLPARALPIVLAAVFDVALNELLERRLKDDPEEFALLIGLNGGEAPVQAFKAKIRLAYLLELLPKEDAELMRALADVRNVFAHRVNAKYSDADVIKHLGRIWEALKKHIETMPKRELNDEWRDWFLNGYIISDYATDAKAARELLLTAHAFLHYRLYLRANKVNRVGRPFKGRIAPDVGYGYFDIEEHAKKTKFEALHESRRAKLRALLPKEVPEGALTSPMTPDNPLWNAFIRGLDWVIDLCGCAGGYDKFCASYVMQAWDMTIEEAKPTFIYFNEHGGHCDCEIIMNIYLGGPNGKPHSKRKPPLPKAEQPDEPTDAAIGSISP